MFHRFFSGSIYVLAVIDVVLISVFFFRLSLLEEPNVDFYDMGVNWWVDGLGWTFFTAGSAWLYYHQHDFESDFSSQFDLHNPFALKLVRWFFCLLVPFATVVAMLRNATFWLSQL